MCQLRLSLSHFSAWSSVREIRGRNIDTLSRSPLVALSMKRLGIPEPPIECMLKCIQNMDHYIRTNHGDSDISYSSKNALIPFQGVLQGNGASPSIWVAVSTPLLNMMRQAGHGMNLTSAISHRRRPREEWSRCRNGYTNKSLGVNRFIECPSGI